jgi:tRNA threonylcarbamoyladenosine biosynthesis protein TsaE
MTIVYGEADLPALGARIAATLRVGDAIGLSGDLGAGKTSLARAILAALGLPGEAPSPSFSIVQPYAPPEVTLPLWHIDLYRIEDPAEIAELGLDEARAEAALLIEWPERLGAGWEDLLRLRIDGDEAERRLTATVPPAWEGRWPFT